MSVILQQASNDPSKGPGAERMLQHYISHYEIGVEMKVLPKEAINPEKKLIASWTKALESARQKAAAATKIQQVQNAQQALDSGALSPQDAVADLPPPDEPAQ